VLRQLKRGVRSFLYLYFIVIFGWIAVVWTAVVVGVLVEIVLGDHVKDEYAFWPLAAAAVMVVPLCAYVTRWLWRHWRRLPRSSATRADG
jgi:hypothetical protein